MTYTTYSNFTENNEFNIALREQFLVVRIMNNYSSKGPDHSNILHTKSWIRQKNIYINNNNNNKLSIKYFNLPKCCQEYKEFLNLSKT